MRDSASITSAPIKLCECRRRLFCYRSPPGPSQFPRWTSIILSAPHRPLATTLNVWTLGGNIVVRISFVIIGVRGEGKIGGMFSRYKSVRLAYICKHMPSVTTEKSPSPFGEYPGHNDLNGLLRPVCRFNI